MYYYWDAPFVHHNLNCVPAPPYITISFYLQTMNQCLGPFGEGGGEAAILV